MEFLFTIFRIVLVAIATVSLVVPFWGQFLVLLYSIINEELSLFESVGLAILLISFVTALQIGIANNYGGLAFL